MPKLLALVVVLLASLVVWQALETQTLRGEIEALRGEVEDLARSRLVAGRTEPDSEPDVLPGRHDAEVSAEDAAAEGPVLAGLSAESETVVRAVRDLRERMEEQERRLGGVEEKVEKAPGRAARSLRPNRMIRNMDQAESVLDLTPRQRSDMERVVEDARRDLEDLRNLPDADGMTWAQVAKPRVVEGDGLTISLPNFGKIQKFVNQRVPGRDETYKQAQERISKDAKRELRGILEPTQQKTWDQAWTDGLLGTSSTGFGIVTSSVSVGSGSKDD